MYRYLPTYLGPKLPDPEEKKKRLMSDPLLTAAGRGDKEDGGEVRIRIIFLMQKIVFARFLIRIVSGLGFSSFCSRETDQINYLGR